MDRITLPDTETLIISIIALVVAIGGTVYQILDRRRVYRASFPRVDLEYTLWATEDVGQVPQTWSKPRFILHNTGKGTARYIHFSGAVERFERLPLSSVMNPFHPGYRTDSWRAVSYTHEVQVLYPEQSVEEEVGDLAGETDNVTVVTFEDPLDKTHYTVARFTVDGEIRNWIPMSPSRTFSNRWRLARYLRRLMGSEAVKDLMRRL